MLYLSPSYVVQGDQVVGYVASAAATWVQDQVTVAMRAQLQARRAEIEATKAEIVADGNADETPAVECGSSGAVVGMSEFLCYFS